MDEQEIIFDMTPALIAFRRVAGNSSRHLNTLAYGVETLKTATPVRPKDIPVAWTMPSTPEEWEEARAFAINMAMVSVIDGLDQYLRELAKLDKIVPDTIVDVLMGRRIAGLDHRPTLPERFDLLSEKFPGAVKQEYLAIVHLLTAWRNKNVHKEYKFGLPAVARKTIINASQYFSDNHQGINVVEMIDAYESGGLPNLHHVGTMVSSVHRLTTSFDEYLLHCINKDDYVVALVKYLIKQSDDEVLFINRLWERGGDQSTGRVLAQFTALGTKVKEGKLRENAPTMSRADLRKLIGFGRNIAREKFLSKPEMKSASPRTVLVRALVKAAESLTEADLEMAVREMEEKADSRKKKSKRG